MGTSDEILNFLVDTQKKGIGDTDFNNIFCLTQYA